MATPLTSSFASVASSENPEQEQELYQADEQRVVRQLHGCLCCCTPCYEEDNVRYSVSLQSDLLRGRAYWTGDLAADYGFHVANAHPLLSCLLCHPAHPYSRLERVAVLVIVSGLTFIPAYAVMEWCKQMQAKQAKESDVTAEDLAAMLLVTELGAQLAILVGVTVPSLILQFILESLAVLDFKLQEGTAFGKLVVSKPCTECLIRCVIVTKQGCMALSLVLAGVLFYLTLTMHGRKSSMFEALGPFLTSRAQSWTVWFVLDGLTPCCGFLARWCHEGKPCHSDSSSSRSKGTSSDKRQMQLMKLPVDERKNAVRKELSTALEALAQKREEAALLQWRIHHLEVELIELETNNNSIAAASANGLPDMGTPDSRSYALESFGTSPPAGWRRV